MDQTQFERIEFFCSETDKYDTTDFMLETLGELASIFFILCPKNPSDMDHFNQRDSSAFIDLIKKLKAKTKMGLHPSYFSEEKGLSKRSCHGCHPIMNAH